MSKIKVNTIAPRSGTTVTLGEAGDTIALGACAAQTGFGRTGTVDWCTTVKTSPLTAVSGKGYFVNTCGGAVTVTLPAGPSAGDIVSVADYKSTWATACKSVTLGRNSSKINGSCNDAQLATDGQSVTMVYIDGTQGWKSVQDSTSDVTGLSFMTATGGTITTSGNYKIHTFTGNGCFQVTSLSGSSPYNSVSYAVVAGGAGGSRSGGGGGGAGGFREGKSTVDSYTASPLAAATGITVTASTYPITVGGGGAGITPSPGSPTYGGSGVNSVFSTITSAGGGGGSLNTSPYIGATGGSGGGGATATPAPYWPAPGGLGNTPPVSPPQGNNGGGGSEADQPGGGGGGGAGAVGIGGAGTPTGTPAPASGSCGKGGAGGAGVTTAIKGPGPTPSNSYGGGGGGGSGNNPTPVPAGGLGGGGTGGMSPNTASTAGAANTGGGGGAGGGPSCNTAGANGGSGVVILRYRYQ